MLPEQTCPGPYFLQEFGRSQDCESHRVDSISETPYRLVVHGQKHIASQFYGIDEKLTVRLLRQEFEQLSELGSLLLH